MNMEKEFRREYDEYLKEEIEGMTERRRISEKRDKILAEEYQRSCKEKTNFAKRYIQKEKIDCGNGCKEKECSFIKPPYFCNLALIMLSEELPVSIIKLEKRFVTIDRILGFEKDPWEKN